MSLRGRLILMSAATVGAVLALAAVACYVVMQSELRGQVDHSLRGQAQIVKQIPVADRDLLTRVPRFPTRSAGGVVPFVQVVAADGRTNRPSADQTVLPVTRVDLEVARGTRAQTIRDDRVGDEHLRVITIPVQRGVAVQFARSLRDVDDTLARLRLLLGVLVLAGIVIAIGVSAVLSRPAIAPIVALTRATEHIEATGDLDRRIDSPGRDEVGRLGRSFNAMLDRLRGSQDALEASTRTQRQLVADASHELRTPVTSLRTNVEVLLLTDDFDEATRHELLSDVVEQTGELTAIVSDLIDLARGDEPAVDTEALDLAELTEDALARARRHSPQLRFDGDIAPWPMTGSRERLLRALNNVLDNAAKFSPPGGVVSVSLHDGELRVRDRGPGVPEAELDHIFNRFFRARNAGNHHGSGLGLAIVKQVVDSHGGSVDAQAAPGGGLVLTLRFPGHATPSA